MKYEQLPYSLQAVIGPLIDVIGSEAVTDSTISALWREIRARCEENGFRLVRVPTGIFNTSELRRILVFKKLYGNPEFLEAEIDTSKPLGKLLPFKRRFM